MDRSKVFAWGIVGIGTATLALLFVDGITFPSFFTLVFWIALLAGAEVLPVSLGYGTQVTMAFPIHLTLAIIFRKEPGVAMVIAGLGAVDLRELKREVPLHRALFNRSLMTLAVGAATFPFAIAGARTPFEPYLVASAALLHLTIDLGLVAVAIHLERGATLHEAISLLVPRPVIGFVVTYLLLTGLGVATALAYTRIENGGWAVAAILIPLLFARLSIVGARTQQELSERVRRQQEALLVATEKVFQEREDERNRIAEDIHDSSLQSLAAAAYGAGNALAFLDADRAKDAREVIETAKDAIDDAIKELRASLVDLRRSVVEQGGIVETVRNFCDQVGTLWGTEVRIEGQIRHEPPIPVALAAFQILQEGLVNALKHAQGSDVLVQMNDEDGMVHIVVKDDGTGFDPTAQVGTEHHGMRLMRERAERVGGRIELDSAPGRGTRLEAILPGGVAR